MVRKTKQEPVAARKQAPVMVTLGNLTRPLRARFVQFNGLEEWWEIDADNTWPGMVMDLHRLGFDAVAYGQNVLVRERPKEDPRKKESGELDKIVPLDVETTYISSHGGMSMEREVEREWPGEEDATSQPQKHEGDSSSVFGPPLEIPPQLPDSPPQIDIVTFLRRRGRPPKYTAAPSYTSDEERKVARRKATRHYGQTEKGKVTRKKAQRRYRQTEKGKENNRERTRRYRERMKLQLDKINFE